MKKNLKLIIPLILIIAIIAIIIIVMNNKEDKYELILESSYGGYGIAGQDLGSGKKTETYNIKEGDKFYEPAPGGGIWLLNYESNGEDEIKWLEPKIIFEVVELENNQAKIKTNGKLEVINYNEECSPYSNFTVADGINYSYRVKIVKK